MYKVFYTSDIIPCNLKEELKIGKGLKIENRIKEWCENKTSRDWEYYTTRKLEEYSFIQKKSQTKKNYREKKAKDWSEVVGY